LSVAANRARAHHFFAPQPNIVRFAG